MDEMVTAVVHGGVVRGKMTVGNLIADIHFSGYAAPIDAGVVALVFNMVN